MPKLKNFFDWTDHNIIKKVMPFYRFLWFIAQILFWVALTFFVTYIVLVSFGVKDFKVSALSDLILLITAAFVLFYTYETQKMRKQMEKAKTAEFMPVVVFVQIGGSRIHKNDSNIKSYKDTGFYLRLKNVGKGIAKELVIFIDGHRMLNHISIQAQNDPIELYTHTNDLKPEILSLLNSEPKKIKIRLEYKDIYENMFCTESALDKEDMGYILNSKWNFFDI